MGHTFRKDVSNVTRQALEWKPKGKRKRGGPKQTWRQSTKDELKSSGNPLRDMQKTAVGGADCFGPMLHKERRGLDQVSHDQLIRRRKCQIGKETTLPTIYIEQIIQRPMPILKCYYRRFFILFGRLIHQQSWKVRLGLKQFNTDSTVTDELVTTLKRFSYFYILNIYFIY